MLTSCVDWYPTRICSSRSAFRYGRGVFPMARTSSPRRRRIIDASKPNVPVPSTRARVGCQTRRRRWISYAWPIAFSATLTGSNSTPTERSTVGTFTRKSALST